MLFVPLFAFKLVINLSSNKDFVSIPIICKHFVSQLVSYKVLLDEGRSVVEGQGPVGNALVWAGVRDQGLDSPLEANKQDLRDSSVRGQSYRSRTTD